MLIYFNYLCEPICAVILFFFFNDTATTEIYTLSLHDALPISLDLRRHRPRRSPARRNGVRAVWRAAPWRRDHARADAHGARRRGRPRAWPRRRGRGLPDEAVRLAGARGPAAGAVPPSCGAPACL